MLNYESVQLEAVNSDILPQATGSNMSNCTLGVYYTIRSDWSYPCLNPIFMSSSRNSMNHMMARGTF